MELEKISPNLGFSSVPNLKEAWNLYFASPSILIGAWQCQYSGMDLWMLVDFALTTEYQLKPELEIGWIPQASQLPSAKYSSLKEFIS